MGVSEFRSKYKNPDQTIVNVETNQPRQEPLLQAVDYSLWAVQRAFERGEMRYFEFLRDKYELIWDVYDGSKYGSKTKKGSCVYDRSKNPFHISLVSSLG